MREGDNLGINQKRLMREMNQYSEDINSNIRFTPDDIKRGFSEEGAEMALEENMFDKLYADNVNKPKKIGSPGLRRASKFLDPVMENRKKKSVKPKSKRVKKKTNGCGCK